MQIEGGTAAVGFFVLETMTVWVQCQFELTFPSAELTFWWPEISWKPSSLAVMWRGLLEHFCIKTFSHKRKQSAVSVDIPYVIVCRDACES